MRITWEVKSSGFETLCTSEWSHLPASVIVRCRFNDELSDTVDELLGAVHLDIYRDVVEHVHRAGMDTPSCPHKALITYSLKSPEGYWPLQGRCKVVGALHIYVHSSVKILEKPYVFSIGHVPVAEQIEQLQAGVEDFAVRKLRDALQAALLSRAVAVTTDCFNYASGTYRNPVVGTTPDGFRIHHF